MWVTGAARATSHRLNSSRLVAAGLALTVLLGTAGFAAGRAASVLHMRITSGAVWLASAKRGSVSLVDGLSAQASAEVQLTGARGHHLVVTQAGDEVLVLDATTGTLIRLNTVELTLGASARTPGGTAVVASVAATYLVNYQSGTAQRIDPVTLTPLGPLVRLPGVPARGAVVDTKGTLWVAFPGMGQ